MAAVKPPDERLVLDVFGSWSAMAESYTSRLRWTVRTSHALSGREWLSA